MEKNLEKYKSSILGMAYEVGAYEINTYLVLKKNNKISFILYKYYDFNSKNKIDEFVSNLKDRGYKLVDEWKEIDCKKLIKSRCLDGKDNNN